MFLPTQKPVRAYYEDKNLKHAMRNLGEAIKNAKTANQREAAPIQRNSG